MRSAMEQIELNTHYSAVNAQRTAMYTEIMTSQMADLLGVAESSLRVQNQQLHVQNAIHTLNQQQLAVTEEQLVQAMRVVQRLDLTNHRLAQIDASLADISGVLVQQNALIQKSLNRLATEAQELIQRGMMAHANEWYTDASRDFEAAIQKDPYSAIAYYFLGKCHYHEGRNHESNQAYQKCIFFARKSAPIFHCVALCDLAVHALKDKNTAEARRFLGEALKCQEQDKPVLISTLLECDLAEGALRPDTCRVALDAFADENVDPEVLLEVLMLKSDVALENGLNSQIAEEKKKWEEATRNALFQRLVSHFYRELDDFVYLAPRIRQGFMEAAGGKFVSLGDPLADLLDWTAMIGEQVLARIELFPPEYPVILRFYRPLQRWNAMLVRLNQLISVLAPKSSLVTGQFVEKLNLGLLELPMMYEDDNILFEVNTEEGDTLALSCYYAIFTRNGVQHFPVRLHDYSMLKIETSETSPTTKTVLVVDPRHGQTLIQGTTGFFTWEGNKKEKLFLIDSFEELASLLAQLHECIDWAIRHENELFSTFLLLHAVAEKMTKRRNAIPRSHQSRRQTEQPLTRNTDEGFEVVEATSPEDDDFEVVEEHDSSNPISS